MKPHDEWNSADIADYARKSMHLEETDYSQHPTKRGPNGAFVFLMMALIVVLVSLALAVIIAPIVMSLEGW